MIGVKPCMEKERRIGGKEERRKGGKEERRKEGKKERPIVDLECGPAQPSLSSLFLDN